MIDASATRSLVDAADPQLRIHHRPSSSHPAGAHGVVHRCGAVRQLGGQPRPGREAGARVQLRLTRPAMTGLAIVSRISSIVPACRPLSSGSGHVSRGRCRRRGPCREASRRVPRSSGRSAWGMMVIAQRLPPSPGRESLVGERVRHGSACTWMSGMSSGLRLRTKQPSNTVRPIQVSAADGHPPPPLFYHPAGEVRVVPRLRAEVMQ